MPLRSVLVIAAAVVLATADVQASDAAPLALSRAEMAVEEARSKQALWLEGARALAAARAALARGDSEESLRQSTRAIELAELGLLQRAGGTGPSASQTRRDR
jgi:hypothetical protein